MSDDNLQNLVIVLSNGTEIHVQGTLSKMETRFGRQSAGAITEVVDSDDKKHLINRSHVVEIRQA
jgi:hypothetical protein